MIWCTFPLLLLASPAVAHGTLPGASGFAAGFAHPFVAIEHLLLLIAVGTLIGRQLSRRPLIGLLPGLMAGFGIAWLPFGVVMADLPAILLLTLVIGALLAANLRLSDPMVIGLTTVAGLAVGAQTEGATGPAALMARSGTVLGVLAIVLNSMAAAQYGASRLGDIPLRVAGSWIAAATLLILAFLLRGGLGTT